MPSTIEKIDGMLVALGMPKMTVFVRPGLFGISGAAQGCGALERKLRLTGIEIEHLRFHMKDGFRVRMLLGERVNALETHLEIVAWTDGLAVVEPGGFVDNHLPDGPAVFASVSR